jgi:hypothetical protein
MGLPCSMAEPNTLAHELKFNMDMILAGLAFLALAVFLFWFNRRQLKRPRDRWDRFARTRQDKPGREPGARRFDRTGKS